MGSQLRLKEGRYFMGEGLSCVLPVQAVKNNKGKVGVHPWGWQRR